MTNPYEASDKYAPDLEREIRLILSNASLRVCSFDEINQSSVRGVVGSSFSDITSRLSKRLRQVIRNTSRQFGIVLQNDELEKQLNALLLSYSASTGYQLKHEIPRKRERLTENVLAQKEDLQQIRRVFATHSRFTVLMALQALDNAVDYSRTVSMMRKGVTHVKWVTEKDQRVCERCRELDGKIFPIETAPGLQHIRCRCHKEPVEIPAREGGK